jgi:succinyl-CoA synthetase beta subunit
MNIHEYQAKAVLKEFGAPIAEGVAIFSPDEAHAAAGQIHEVSSSARRSSRSR